MIHTVQPNKPIENGFVAERDKTNKLKILCLVKKVSDFPVPSRDVTNLFYSVCFRRPRYLLPAGHAPGCFQPEVLWERSPRLGGSP
jgi:hypothetical protein